MWTSLKLKNVLMKPVAEPIFSHMVTYFRETNLSKASIQAVRFMLRSAEYCYYRCLERVEGTKNYKHTIILFCHS